MIYFNCDNTELLKALATVDRRPNPGSYAQAARQLTAEFQELQELRVSLLASFTIDGLTPYLRVAAAQRGFLANVNIAPFNTVHQQLLDPASELHSDKPDVVVVTQLVEDVCPSLVWETSTLGQDQMGALIEETVQLLERSVLGFRERSSAPLIIANFPKPLLRQGQLHDTVDPHSLKEVVARLNQRLEQMVAELPGVYILDAERLFGEVGYRRAVDARLWHIGRAPLTFPLMVHLASELASFFYALTGTPKKCLVLDLDNTLWGGVIGEDGIEGISIGQTFPGNIYQSVQYAALELHRRGILLAISSKNNEADAMQVLTSHPNMILRPEHFSAFRINWNPKPQSIKEIAEELNIGVDSMVFVDDNPAEVEAVRMLLPEVLAIGVHDANHQPDPLVALDFLSSGRCFERLSVTAEDRQRNAMYAQQKERRKLAEGADSLASFLRQLMTSIDVRPADKFTLPRVVELIKKTNQFNLTTKRHNESQLQAWSDSDRDLVLTGQVQDRFGDHGIVLVAIVHVEGSRAHLNSFLMSCRVIGRGVETAMLRQILDLLQERGVKQLSAEFVPTSKNAPASSFLADQGFIRSGQDGEESSWSLDLATHVVEWPDHILNAQMQGT